MKLLSIQVGKPKDVFWQGKRVSTGIFKAPIPGPVWVRQFNIEGDGQADLTVHGGRDKAVYAYSQDAYPWWLAELKVAALPPGAFGENLTFESLDEKGVGIGDKYALGACVLQVTQPRFPCFKLGIKFNDLAILKTFMKSGRPGVYFRVLTEGKIAIGEVLQRIEVQPQKVSVVDFFGLKANKYADKSMVKRLLKISDLNEEWREIFEKQVG